MHGYIQRELKNRLVEDLSLFPAVALLGPRQAGKSTLAREIAEELPACLYLDLESPGDMAKLADPELFLQMHTDKTVILDEIQTLPEIFPVIRSVIDRDRRPGRFLLLGSASRQLINHSAESLAGRIGFLELGPILPSEYGSFTGSTGMKTGLSPLLVRGGFPESLLADNDNRSYRWREEFIRSYIERDLPQLGITAPTPLVRKLLQMLAHLQGQLLNMSKIAESLGISPGSVRHYLDFLQEALLLRLLPAWSGNLKKRLVKSPKIFIRDTGLVNSLLQIPDFDTLIGHPNWGAAWETLVVESALSWCGSAAASFYRTSNGSEIDLVLEQGTKRIIIEAKASTTPNLSKGFWTGKEALQPDAAFVCAPVDTAFPLRDGVMALPLHELKKELQSLLR